MGEIKSTFEIIMEKLNKVQVTEEDKERLRQKELKEKISTIFKKYSNKTISEEEVIQQLKDLGNLEKNDIKELVCDNLLSLICIEHTKINGISLLLKLYPEKATKINELQKNIEKKMLSLEGNLKNKMLKILSKKDIKGSAIIPNVLSMSEWKDLLEQETRNVKEKLEFILNQ